MSFIINFCLIIFIKHTIFIKVLAGGALTSSMLRRAAGALLHGAAISSLPDANGGAPAPSLLGTRAPLALFVDAGAHIAAEADADLVLTLIDRLLANADDIVRYNVVSGEAVGEGDESDSLASTNGLASTLTSTASSNSGSDAAAVAATSTSTESTATGGGGGGGGGRQIAMVLDDDDDDADEDEDIEGDDGDDGDDDEARSARDAADDAEDAVDAMDIDKEIELEDNGGGDQKGVTVRLQSRRRPVAAGAASAPRRNGGGALSTRSRDLIEQQSVRVKHLRVTLPLAYYSATIDGFSMMTFNRPIEERSVRAASALFATLFVGQSLAIQVKECFLRVSFRNYEN